MAHKGASLGACRVANLAHLGRRVRRRARRLHQLHLPVRAVRRLLEKAGAGNYFIQLAFALLGQFRGGPAKAGVVSSGMTGMISGSSVANMVTTGTFTIPLMKRVGYPAVKAGAIECAAGVNGQLMPPVMGAAAFLMAEYVGITYAEVVKHAFLPAILTYGALFYIVDLEAVKAGMRGLPRAAHGALRTSRCFAGADDDLRHRHPERRSSIGVSAGPRPCSASAASWPSSARRCVVGLSWP